MAVLFSAAMSVGMYREADSAWLQVIPLSLILIAWYGWPRTIHLDETGISQRSRFGLKTRVNYMDVVALTHADGTITATGSSGIIEHTQYHAAVGRFAQLISERSGKEVYWSDC